MSNTLQTLTSTLGGQLGLGNVDTKDLVETLKATAFSGQCTDAQMIALLTVSNKYKLNPWLKEIYAFPDQKSGGIVPIVGVDGWANIINSHPQYDGMEFEQDANKCTCIIYRKDRTNPTKVTEYLSECTRGTATWKSHPMRMLRHKAMIQCARLAFSFSGIHDEDEAARIVSATSESRATIDITPKTNDEVQSALPDYPQEKFIAMKDQWKKLIDAGQTSPTTLIAMMSTKFNLTDRQKNEIINLGAING